MNNTFLEKLATILVQQADLEQQKTMARRYKSYKKMKNEQRRTVLIVN